AGRDDARRSGAAASFAPLLLRNPEPRSGREHPPVASFWPERIRPRRSEGGAAAAAVPALRSVRRAGAGLLPRTISPRGRRLGSHRRERRLPIAVAQTLAHRDAAYVGNGRRRL